MEVGLHPASSPPLQSVIQTQRGASLVTLAKSNLVRLQPGSTSHTATAGNLAF